MKRTLLIVCDDAGFASVDRGIRRLAEETGVHLFADYMIEQEGAADRMKEMASVPNVSLGLHAELSGFPDDKRHYYGKELQGRGTSLGEQPEIQKQGIADTRRQVALFREISGRDPAHIGTHGNFHTDAQGHIMEWWKELMHDLFGEQAPPQQCACPIVRHHMYSWNIEPTARLPRTPEEFAQELRHLVAYHTLEFVLHPALPGAGDESLDMLFDAQMRIRDLEAAIEIIRSGVIEREGFMVASTV